MANWKLYGNQTPHLPGGELTSYNILYQMQERENGQFALAYKQLIRELDYTDKFGLGPPGIKWDISRFTSTINRILEARRFDSGYGEVLRQTMELVLGYCKKICPYDKNWEKHKNQILSPGRLEHGWQTYEEKHPYGHLADNLYYMISPDGRAAMITVDMNKFPYAAIQHETPSPIFTHLPGKSWKFIEIPMHVIGKRMPASIATNFLVNLERAIRGLPSIYQEPYAFAKRIDTVDDVLRAITLEENP